MESYGSFKCVLFVWPCLSTGLLIHMISNICLLTQSIYAHSVGLDPAIIAEVSGEISDVGLIQELYLTFRKCQCQCNEGPETKGSS